MFQPVIHPRRDAERFVSSSSRRPALPSLEEVMDWAIVVLVLTTALYLGWQVGRNWLW